MRIIIVIVVFAMPLMGYSQIDTLPINMRELLDKSNIIDDTTHSEKHVVVTVGRGDKSVDELPVTVYIIWHDEIIRNGYITLCDVLKSVPGLRVSQPHSGDLGEAFLQRGMVGNTYTKILLNGVDIKPTAPTGMPLGANLPIRQAERIEIVYGPAAANYGNDACGGVINIITKHDFDKTYASADAVTGPGGYHYINFGIGGKFGRGKHVAEYTVYGCNLRYDDMKVTDYDKDDIYNRWNYFAQRDDVFTYKDADGNTQSFAPNQMTAEVYNNMRYLTQLSQFTEILGYSAGWHGDVSYPDFAKISQEAAQTGIELKYQGVTFSYNYLYRKDFSALGMTPMFFDYSDPDNMMGERILRAAVSGDWDFGNFSINTVVKYIRYRMDENSQRHVTYSNLVQYGYSAGDDMGFEQYFTYHPVKYLNLSAGFTYQYTGVLPYTNETPYKFDFDSYHCFAKSVDYTDPLFGDFGIYPYTCSNTGAYGQVVFDWNRLSITGGARYDNNSIFGHFVTPRIAALVKITDHLTFRASRGYANKMPSAQQLYGTTAVDASIAVNAGLRLRGQEPMTGVTLIAYHQTPAKQLAPEKIASTELGLRYYLSDNKYLEFVAYTNRIRNPLVRDWCELDPTLPNAYVRQGDATEYNDTRTYITQSAAEVKLRGYQWIAVIKDWVKPMHLNFKCGITMSGGGEEILDSDAGVDDVKHISYIRQVPKCMVQWSVDFDFLKLLHLSLENVYCSKWARKYYRGNDNSFLWSTPYYNLDLMFTVKMGKHLAGSIKLNNVFNAQYGGIDVKDMDVDLPYNPQLLRQLRFVLTYEFK